MSTEVKLATTALFPEAGPRASNVKWFLGKDRGVTAEQLAGQLNRADAQIRTGTAQRSTSLDGHLVIKSVDA